MSAAPASHSLMSIGEVLTQLRADFPDVTISKIRFLESEGLVEPARTPSGYRKFSHADVGRLHYVLATQRDHYLPLRVIKDHLDALDRGLEPPAVPGERPQVPSSAGRPDWLPGPRALGETTELRLSRTELMSSASIDDALLTEIEGYGLVAVEASALGTPTIVVRSPDNAAVELVQDGENGVIADSAEPQDLADAILRVHAAGPELRSSTAEWFRRNRERLSLESSLDTVLDIYGR